MASFRKFELRARPLGGPSLGMKFFSASSLSSASGKASASEEASASGETSASGEEAPVTAKLEAGGAQSLGCTVAMVWTLVGVDSPRSVVPRPLRVAEVVPHDFAYSVRPHP